MALERLAMFGTVLGGGHVEASPESQLISTELRRQLGDAIDEMPEMERLVILMAYRDELTQSEIAERLGWPLGTVKTRTRRALHRLREVLADTLGPELAPSPMPVEVGE